VGPFQSSKTKAAKAAFFFLAAEGMIVEGRDGQTRAHPLLAVERSAVASYQWQLKTLGIKF